MARSRIMARSGIRSEGNPDRCGPCLYGAAIPFIGIRFRLHGRDPATGLDCIGLLLAACAALGRHFPAPDDYPLRGMTRGAIVQLFDDSGLVLRIGPPRTGDIVLTAVGFGQHHAAILGPSRHIHAHAGLRRIVETPGWPDPVVRVWHL